MEDDEEEEEEDVLTLTDQDRDMIDMVKSFARDILRRPRASPRLIAAVGFALQALDKFPDAPEGLSVELSVCYRYNGESKYVDFRVSDQAFEVSCGGSEDSGWGHDTVSGHEYRLEVTGHAARECDRSEVEQLVSELLNLGAKITTTVEGGSFEEVWES